MRKSRFTEEQIIGVIQPTAFEDFDHAAQLRRFIGTRSGRKHRYGSILAEAVASEQIPRPLADMLTAMQPG